MNCSELTEILTDREDLNHWLQQLEAHDPNTAAHSSRVAELSVKLAHKMGMRTGELSDVYQGALLHDIGKMDIPLSILKKAGPLEPAEWEIMKSHPQKGFEILKRGDFPWNVLEIVYCHHEHWAGTGYPRGLSSTEIPLMARVVSVADGYDTGTSDRPYAKALPQNKVLKIIQGMSGEIFDPTVVATLLELCEEGF